MRAGLVVAMLLWSPLAAVAGQISLAWDPSSSTVAGYRVYWGTAPGLHTTGSLDAGNQTTAIVPNLTDGITYYFIVKAYSSSGVSSAPSNEVSGTTGSQLSFTDDPLVPGVHVMKAQHMSELRSRIDSLRKTRGLAPASWTPLVANSTVISASHIAQLRSALDAVYQSLGLTLPIYLDNLLTAGATIKAVHITQLRTLVKALE